MQMQQTTYWFILSTYCELEVLFLWHESALSNTPVNTGNSAEMSFRTGGHWKAESESRLRLSWRLQTSAHFTSLLIMALRVFMSPSRAHLLFFSSSLKAAGYRDSRMYSMSLSLKPSFFSCWIGLVWMCGCHWLLFWDWCWCHAFSFVEFYWCKRKFSFPFWSWRCRRSLWFWVMFVNPNS